jgi:hypothetical protein
MEQLFLYYAAPILCDAKPAALIPLKPHCLPAWKERRNALQKATGLRTLELKSKNGSLLLLIYDEAALADHLRDSRASPFLARYGYPAGCDPGEALRLLQERFLQGGFPHEIGIFLGYPPKDVQAFIDNEGRNCVCCRYWKVYHDVERAQEAFRRIDEAHSRAIDILCEPKPIHIAVRLLRAA